jgi:hypothetical protein
MKSIQKYLSVFLSVALMSMSFSNVQAALVGNALVINQAQHHTEKAQLLETINRSDVKAQLLSLGVSAKDIETRINLMTHQEIAQLNQQIDDLPAGGDLLGIILIIFIIFVITDVIGATDIFPFIKPVN